MPHLPGSPPSAWLKCYFWGPNGFKAVSEEAVALIFTGDSPWDGILPVRECSEVSWVRPSSPAAPSAAWGPAASAAPGSC